MGNELRKLMQQFGVSTPSMANYSGTAMPGAAPTAVKELLKPADLRAQPVEPIKPTKPRNNAPAEEKAAYQVALDAYNTNKAAYDADLKTWKTEKKTYDTAIKDYNTALPQYEKDLSKYNADKAAFDEQVRKYGLDRAAYDKYASDYQNRIGNTNLYNQAQFSTTGANVPAFTTYSDAQKAAMGMMPAQQAPIASTQVMPPVDAQPALGPQDFAGIGQGGLNNYIQQYMGTNPSMSDMQDMQKRYGFNEYDVRNAMGTGTTYGAPQWTDTLASPVYSAPTIGSPLGELADTLNGTNTGTTTGTNTGTTTGTNTGTTTGTNTGTTATVYDPNQVYWDDPNWIGSAAWQEWKSNNRARGGYIQNYAQGGSVKGYRPGGPVDMLYGGAGDAMMMGRPAGDRLATPAPAPVDPMAEMRAMLDLYAPSSVTSEQIAAAAERRVAEQKAFEDILRSQLQGTDGEPMSKAEKYFRLAAAFGAPTKTGHFAENLGLVGEEMASQLAAKAQREREAREKRLGVDLEIQKMRMGTAGEEYDALRGVQSEEAKYRRDLGNKLIMEHISSGKAQSDAGKIAVDMGFVEGTPEYNAKVKELVDLDVARKQAEIDARITAAEADPAAFRALDLQARAAGFMPEREGGDGSYEEFMATRGAGLVAEAGAMGKARGEATAAAPSDIRSAEEALDYIESIRTHPGRQAGTGGSSWVGMIPGTEAREFQIEVKRLGAGAFLQAIEQLRGMGALSNAEGQTATAAVAALETEGTEEGFLKRLGEYEEIVKIGLERAQNILAADSGLTDEDLQYLGGN